MIDHNFLIEKYSTYQKYELKSLVKTQHFNQMGYKSKSAVQ